MNDWTNDGTKSQIQLMNGEKEVWTKLSYTILMVYDTEEEVFMIFVRYKDNVQSYAFTELDDAHRFIKLVRANPDNSEHIYKFFKEVTT